MNLNNLSKAQFNASTEKANKRSNLHVANTLVHASTEPATAQDMRPNPLP